MTERKCEGCRFFDKFTGFSNGLCRRMPPSPNSGFPPVESYSSCGEWKNKSITPEQEQRAEQMERFALAIIESGADVMMHDVWKMAAEYVDNEPGRFNVPK